MDEVECDLWYTLVCLDGSDDCQFWDLERENSLGGEGEGRVGEKGISCDLFMRWGLF